MQDINDVADFLYDVYKWILRQAWLWFLLGFFVYHAIGRHSAEVITLTFKG